MSWIEGVFLFLALMLFYRLGYAKGELDTMECQLMELKEELNDV